jgi:RNA recognition motif-containing protein
MQGRFSKCVVQTSNWYVCENEEKTGGPPMCRQVRDADLRDVFGRFGKLKGLTLLAGSHCAFVDFVSPDAAAAARNSTNGRCVASGCAACE